VVVGTRQGQFAQGAAERLLAPAGVTCRLSAVARKAWTVVVGPVRIEPLLQSPGRDTECTLARRRLDGLEVQTINGARAYERFDLGRDLRVEGFLEPPFLAPSCKASDAVSLASQSCSLISTSSRVSWRNRRHSAICSFVCGTADTGMILVTVLPCTPRVSDQLGPCPAESWPAQWQLGLPHFR